MTPTLPFPDPRARRTDPLHSHEAARGAKPTEAVRQWILDVAEPNAAYIDECFTSRGTFAGPTIRRTIKAMLDAGELVELHEVGKTAAGNKCRQWRRV